LTGNGSPEGMLPAPLGWAIRLLYAEAAAVAVVTGYLVYEDVTGTATDVRAAILVTLYALALAAALGGLAYALSRRRPWARGPVVAIQLLLVPVGYYLATGGQPWYGIPIALVGLVVAGLLVAPSSTKALGVGPNRAD
jgi:peptidoglycan/LPS O-acetylase OafA/YrhL